MRTFLTTILSLFWAFGFCQAALAGHFKTSGAQVSVLSDVPVFKEAKWKGKKLLLTGAGTRVKKVVLVKAKVYVAAHYTDEAKPVVESSTRAMHLTFLRDVDAEKIRSSFTDSLKENGVDPENSAVKHILSALTFSMKDKGTLTLIGETGPGREILTLEGPTTTRAESKDVVTSFWKIWFGKPADGGLEDLQEELLRKN
jgi:hypothetical protein